VKKELRLPAKRGESEAKIALGEGRGVFRLTIVSVSAWADENLKLVNLICLVYEKIFTEKITLFIKINTIILNLG